jgi:hypothetical protein
MFKLTTLNVLAGTVYTVVLVVAAVMLAVPNLPVAIISSPLI